MFIEIRKITRCGLLFWLFMGVFPGAQAQELLLGLSEIDIPETKTSQIVKTKSIVNRQLPFVDDFSKNGQVVPDSKLWDNSRSVFVNNVYAINPVTVGVATFDPFDGKGKIYANASNSTFPADTLTSAPIDLAYHPQDSIYLSFYIQPQGYGDMPEINDSLSLEFYSPTENKWNNVWSASVISTTELLMSNHLQNTTTTIKHDSLGYNFFRANIKIDKFEYLTGGFGFRFINYASISVHTDFPGRSTASDHWHLDYVYLDKNRHADNQNIPDIAIIKEQKRILMNYETVPAVHFDVAKSELFNNPITLELNYTNLGWGTKSVTRNFRLRSIYGTTGRTLSYSAGSENIQDGSTIDLSYSIPQYELSVDGDSASFELLSWLVTDNDPADFRAALRYNDTSRTVYTFKDYYAYDDGTAENGYGLFGNGSSNGKVAIKFFTYMADSLRGISMYFNRAVNDANEKHKFTLAVWRDMGGMPGELIHKDEGAKPAFKDSLNQFVVYKFSKPVYLSKNEVFYVGWLQTDEGFLNVGFDRNRNSKDKAFYNLGQNWEPSAFDGSLMIRPIFCRTDSNFPSDYVEFEPEEESGESGASFVAHPNPARGIIYLSEHNNTPVNSSKIELYALSGKLVKVFENVTGNIDLTSVSSGIYLIRVWDANNRVREVKKIIVVN
jgi:hypothetical protein